MGNIRVARSENWAGYAVTRKKVTFKKIIASFFVPFLNCAASPNTFSSAWVGLDGFNTRTVEQDGISADCKGSTPEYAAWYETFPNPEIATKIVVHAGDSITASVTFNRRTSKYAMALTDNSNGHRFKVSQKCAASACKHANAEVISEAPTVGGNLASLSDYGAESFASIAITSTKGKTGGISSTHWTATRIIQVGTTSKAPIGVSTLLHGPTFDNYWLGEN